MTQTAGGSWGWLKPWSREAGGYDWSECQCSRVVLSALTTVPPFRRKLKKERIKNSNKKPLCWLAGKLKPQHLQARPPDANSCAADATTGNCAPCIPRCREASRMLIGRQTLKWILRSLVVSLYRALFPLCHRNNGQQVLLLPYN